jgi:hypothetical protein
MPDERDDEGVGVSGTGTAEHAATPGKNDALRLVLRLWKEGHVTQDVRYENKGLLKLISLSLTDTDFRNRLLSDPEATLAEVPPGHLPEGIELKFHENTPDTIHVVLPPLGGGLEHRSPRFQERIFSRTSQAGESLFADDADLGDWSLDADRGDPDSRDSMNSAPPIIVVAEE